MNLFCRLLGHTWVHQSENPKVRWSTSKNQSELDMTASGEPRFWLECVRCKEKRPYPMNEGERRAS